jgi:hypothetical protein
MPRTPQTKDRHLAMPRALLRKHTRITKKGRVKLEKGWDKRIAKKADAEVTWCAGYAAICTVASGRRSCASRLSKSSDAPPDAALAADEAPVGLPI